MAANAATAEIFQTLHAAEQVARRVRALLGSVGPSFQETQFYSRVRVKSYDSIVGKIYRKKFVEHPRRPDYSFRDLKDLVGLRLVTLYDEELLDAAKLLVHLIATGKSLHQPLFAGVSLWDSIAEAEFYKRRLIVPDVADVYSECRSFFVEEATRDIDIDAASVNKKFQLRDRVDRYSSAHIVVNALSYVNGVSRPIPVEMQLRTAAEDIWGEINHELLYKFDDHHCWSGSIAASKKELADDSLRLKTNLDILPADIARFRRHAVELTQRVERFKRPTTNLHSSVVVSLFYSLSGDFLDRISDSLAAYERALKELQQIGEPQEAAEKVVECIQLCKTIEVVMSDTKTETPRGSIDYNICDQRTLLAGFEVIRLRALCLIQFRYEINPTTLTLQSAADKRIAREAAESLFHEFISFEATEALLVRPTTVIAFWKYLLAERYDPRARRFLDEAYSELPHDFSLPMWSIYRILVPRFLASELAQDIAAACDLVSEKSTVPLESKAPRFRYLKTDIMEGLQYAREAFELSKTSDTRRGDLLFGHGRKELIIDAEAFLQLYLFGTEAVGLANLEETSVSAEFVDEVIEDISEKIGKIELNLEETRQFTQLVRRIKEARQR